MANYYFKEPGNCKVCGWELKPAKQREKYTYYVCHPCKHKRYPDKKNTVRSYHLNKKGLTTEWYEGLLKEQDNKCAICLKPPSEMRGENVKHLNVDHDHNCCKTGCAECVRGLLCSNCNRALGKFYDNIDLLQNAINYLKKWEKK